MESSEYQKLMNKIEQNHDVHIRNEETLKGILQHTSKTNGRVTRLEDITAKQDTTIALLSQSLAELKEANVKLYNLSSKQDGLLMAQWEKAEAKFASKDDLSPVIKILWAIGAIVGTGFLGVIGSALIYYIQHK